MHQIRNVLRVYGNQLKRRSSLFETGFESGQPSSDFVDISVEARKKQVLNQLSNRLVSELKHRGHEEAPGTGALSQRTSRPEEVGEPDNSGGEEI